MRSISFAWTTPAILARSKHCTRRHWKDRFAQTFKRYEQLNGLDKVFFAGGKIITQVELTEDVYQDHISNMPDSDYEQEGFAYLQEINHPLPKHWAKCGTWSKAFDFWRSGDEKVWVVRFDYNLSQPLENTI